MNLLLLFFAIPLAIIILSIVLQKILKCPLLVAATFFAIFLIVTFAIGDLRLIVFTIAYTIIAFVTATIVKIICEIRCNGLTFRNINTENINARTANANVLRANRIINNANIDNDDDNDNCNCNCGCNCNCNRGFIEQNRCYSRGFNPMGNQRYRR